MRNVGEGGPAEHFSRLVDDIRSLCNRARDGTPLDREAVAEALMAVASEIEAAKEQAPQDREGE